MSDKNCQGMSMRESSSICGAFGTNLPFLTKEIVTIENGAEVYTDSTAYDGKLYLYQK